MHRTMVAVPIVLIFLVALFTLSAGAQSIPSDTLKVNYFSNANTTGTPDATMRMTDPGTVLAVGTNKPVTVPNICAYIAVFDANQEMSECCGCLLTPDGLVTQSVNNDLTSNPLTGVKLQTGVIKVVSAAPYNNTCPLPGQVSGTPTITPAIRAWVTHIQNNGAITETASQDATLSSAELNRLGAECNAIVIDGSGSGICSCGVGQ